MDEYELYNKFFSIPQISKKLNIPKSTIRFRLKKRGLLRDRIEALKLCFTKGNYKSTKGIKRPNFSDEWKKNISIGKIKSADKNAKGVSLKSNGYYEITRGLNKGRGLHVVLMEQFIGRKLYYNECVHHKDFNKLNNNLNNLQLMTKKEHSSLHGKYIYKKRKRNSYGQFE